MKILICPMNGPRNIDEFQNLGPLRADPDPDRLSDAEWSSHLFRAENRRGIVTEWWRHVPSNFHFLAERDLVTNEVRRTFEIAALDKTTWAAFGPERPGAVT